MVTTLKHRERPATEEVSRPVKARRPMKVTLVAVVLGIALGASAFAVVNGNTGLDPAEIAELRAEEYAEISEARWLEDPANIAQLRAAEYAEISRQRWLAEQD